MDDREVVAAIAAGDPAGIAAAYDRHAATLYGYCHWTLRKPTDAVEVLRDTFVIAATTLGNVSKSPELRPWLYAVARNECQRRPRVASAAHPEEADATDREAVAGQWTGIADLPIDATQPLRPIRQPASPTDQPASPADLPADATQPLRPIRQPASPTDQPASPADLPADATQPLRPIRQPASPTDQPASPADLPADATQPLRPIRQPASPTDQPASPADLPADATQPLRPIRQPASPTDQPASPADLPADATQPLRPIRQPASPTDQPASPADRMTIVNDAPGQADLSTLIRVILAELTFRDREVIELSVRHDLYETDLATALGVSWNQAYALSSHARRQLEKALGPWFIARTGRGTCPALEALLVGGDGQLAGQTRKRVGLHIEQCVTCASRRRSTLRSAVLSGLSPLAPLPTELREQVLELCSSTAPDAVAYRQRVSRRAESVWFARLSQAARQVGWDPEVAAVIAVGVVWAIVAVGVALYIFVGYHPARALAARPSGSAVASTLATAKATRPAPATVSASARPSPAESRPAAAGLPTQVVPSASLTVRAEPSLSRSTEASPSHKPSPTPSPSQSSPSPSPSATG